MIARLAPVAATCSWGRRIWYDLVMSARIAPGFVLLKTIVAAGLLVVLSACALSNPLGLGPGVSAGSLREGKYQASWLADGLNPEPSYQPFATANVSNEMNAANQGDSFLGGDFVISFNGGCNSITGVVRGSRITVGGMTEMACLGDTFEPTLLENLDNRDFQIINNEQFSVGDLLFTWWLEPGATPPPDPNAILRDGDYQGGLEETDGNVVSYTYIATAVVAEAGTQFTFDAGCNVLRTSLVDGALAPIAGTRMACPPDSHEDVFLAHANSGEFQVLSDTSFRVGDITFGWVPTEFAAAVAEPARRIELAVMDSRPPGGDIFGTLTSETYPEDTPLYGFGQINDQRVLILNLWGSSSCPPIIKTANIESGSLFVQLDGEAYAPDQACTDDLARHIFILAPTDSGDSLPDNIEKATLDRGVTRTADGAMTHPSIEIMPADS